MSDKIVRPDEVDVRVTDDRNLPDGWEKIHEEERRPVDDVGGYYLRTYESKHFLVTQENDRRNGEMIHKAVLLKVKRGDDGERLTSLGTGIYKLVGTAEDTPEYVEDTDSNVQAHKDAEKAAFQLAIDIIHDVNAGKYEEKKYSESNRYD